MGIAAMRVPTIFTAIDRFSDVVDRMTSKTSRFGESASAAFSRVDKRINGVWNSMNGLSQLALGGGTASLFYYAGKDIMDYETAIHSLSAVTGTSVGAMNRQIEDLSKTSQRSAIDVAKSFEIVGSKMSEYLDKPDALKEITKNSILMAEAARMELEPAIDSLTGVLNIYGLAAKDANRVVNKLSAGEIVGSISISQTADLLRQFGGTARLANVGVEESIALVQTLTKSLGVEGVGRGIRNLMVDLNMVGAFDKNKTKALQKAGVNTKVLGDKTLDLVTRLKELKKLEGNSAAMGMFFKKTGIQTGATLFQNFDDLERFLKAIQNTNKAEEQAAKNTDTLSYTIKRLKANFTNFIVTSKQANLGLTITKSVLGWISDNIGGIVTGVVLMASAFILWKGVVAIVWALNGAMVAYKFIMTLAALANVSFGVALWTALWPITLVVLAIVALSVAIYDMVGHWSDWKEILLLSIGPLGWIISGVIKFAKHWNSITSAFSTGGVLEGFKAIGRVLLDMVLAPLQSIMNIISRIPGMSFMKNASNYISGVRDQNTFTKSGSYNIYDPSKMSTVGASSGAGYWDTKKYQKIDSAEERQTKISGGFKGSLEVNVKDKGGNVESVQKSWDDLIPIKISQTTGSGVWSNNK